MIRFTLPYPPKPKRAAWLRKYGLNAYYAGKHWARRKKDAEYWHWMVREQLRKQGVRGMCKGPVSVTFRWNDGLDCDNHAAMGKMIVDALKGVVLQDDDRRCVSCVRHEFHEEDWIEVVIE